MGELFKDGDSRPIASDDLAMDRRARDLHALQQVPIFQSSHRSNEYVFLAFFDGTGQDVNDPRQRPTNIGSLARQAELLERDPDNRVASHYVEGIGTQARFLPRIVDQFRPFTWDDKIAEAYVELSRQTRRWKEGNADAQVRVAGVGYSRGAVLSAGLARLVDERGILHPEDLRFGHDANGNLTVNSDRPPLVPPGHTAQALALLDPVATNMPKGYDARVPPSVVSALSIAAAHEQRTSFPHQTIIEPGLSQDRRFASVLMPGGHSNIGGGAAAAGLESMAHNRMVDYLNGLRDQPVFEYRDLPDDPAQYTVYQARGVTAVPGLDRDGLRDTRTELANCTVVDLCRNAEPMDSVLAGQFEYRHLPSLADGPVFSEPLQTVSRAASAGTSPCDAAEKREASATRPQPGAATPDRPDHPHHELLLQIRGHTLEREREGAIRFGDDHERERFCRYALAACVDNRREHQSLYPGRSSGGNDAGIARADHIVIGTRHHAFVIQGDARDPAARRIAFTVEDARQTPVEQSDRALADAGHDVALPAAAALQREASQHPRNPIHDTASPVR